MTSFKFDSKFNDKNIEKQTGTVIEALPNAFFRVRLDDGKEILTYLAGKMRMYRIKVLVGDKVVVEIDPYGGKGRIVRRT
ncbi:MAG: translation initiation factor IF-1 [Parcubacteria group bacterium]|nr:translation initiation factor IF-1 [Parcubacteria group bacterium]